MWTPQPDFFQTTSQTFGERSRWWKTAVFGSPRCSPNGPLCGEVWQHCSSRAGGRKKSLTSLLWWHMMIYTGSPKFFRILVDFPRISTKSFRLIWICFVGDDIPLNPSQIFPPGFRLGKSQMRITESPRSVAMANSTAPLMIGAFPTSWLGLCRLSEVWVNGLGEFMKISKWARTGYFFGII